MMLPAPAWMRARWAAVSGNMRSMKNLPVTSFVSMRASAVLRQLAADEVERLDAVGAFVDHGDAGVAHELLHAVLLNVAVAAEYLLRDHRVLEALVGENAFDHRRQQAHVIVGGLAGL